VPAAAGGQGATVAVNYVRQTYDVRMSTSNAILINSAAQMFRWSGEETFLRQMLPNLRRATLFLLEHLLARREGIPCFDWMVGKDGLGGPEPGHGMIGSYWDLLPAGRFDIESSVAYCLAMRRMADLERAAVRRHIVPGAASVIGPDGRTPIAYHETPASLDRLAARARREIERRFWVEKTGRFCRNIDSRGRRHDYGFLHFNLLALAHGIGTEEQRRSVLSWLDGRAIAGDTSTGPDIFRFRFAPRTSTRDNPDYYFWPWVGDMKHPLHQFGNQVQNGGAVPFASLFELMVRAQSGDPKQVARAFARTLEIRDWYSDVKAAGGRGAEFYRAYYNGHPERGIQQGGGPPGGLGLDREFLGDAGMGTLFLLKAFLGVETEEDGVLTVAPAIPTALGKVGVTNVFYHGNRLTIEAGKAYVSLAGSALPHAAGLKLRLVLRNLARGKAIVAGGQPCRQVTRLRDGSTVLVLDLAPVRVSWDTGGAGP